VTRFEDQPELNQQWLSLRTGSDCMRPQIFKAVLGASTSMQRGSGGRPLERSRRYC
jgi:hypothetical protein